MVKSNNMGYISMKSEKYELHMGENWKIWVTYGRKYGWYSETYM